MSTTTLTPGAAQLALFQSDANNKMALMRRDAADLKKANDYKDQQIAHMSAGLSIQTTRGRVMMGLSTAVTAGTAMAGGALDGYLGSR